MCAHLPTKNTYRWLPNEYYTEKLSSCLQADNINYTIGSGRHSGVWLHEIAISLTWTFSDPIVMRDCKKNIALYFSMGMHVFIILYNIIWYYFVSLLKYCVWYWFNARVSWQSSVMETHFISSDSDSWCQCLQMALTVTDSYLSFPNVTATKKLYLLYQHRSHINICCAGVARWRI